MAALREMTDVLVQALTAAGIFIQRVERCAEAGDSDGIYLADGQALFVDYDAFPVVCVSLNDVMPVGGNVEIANWTLNQGYSVESIVNAVKVA